MKLHLTLEMEPGDDVEKVNAARRAANIERAKMRPALKALPMISKRSLRLNGKGGEIVLGENGATASIDASEKFLIQGRVDDALSS